MNIRVRNALSQFIPDSEATVFYLQLCSEIASSLMDHDIIPQQRIEMLFHVVYFLRIWKKWIQSSGYSSRNFLTSNAYMCIETNAENLLKLVRRFRDEEKQELFLTTLFDSQACERAFRQFRAMGTPNFTRVNFTLYELLHMTRRIEVQNDILYTKLPHVTLPKLEKSREMTKIYALPSEEEITQCLIRAKRFALEDASKFGMQINSIEIDECELPIPKKIVNDNEEHAQWDDTESDENFENDAFTAYDEVDDDFHFPENDDTLQHGFLHITDPANPNKKLLMRKSTFVWHLTEGSKKMSSDRLIRVQQTESPTNLQQITKNCSRDITFALAKNVAVNKYIQIGDWCVFKRSTSDDLICIGSILGFKFGKGRTAKEKRYKGDSVDLKEYQKGTAKANELQVLSSWYNINEMKHLIPVKDENHFFINIENYVATIAKPVNDKDTAVLFFPERDFEEMENDILAILREH